MKEMHEPFVNDSIYNRKGELQQAELMKQAKLLFDHKEYSLARQIYVSLTQARPHVSQAYLELARCYECEGLLTKAIDAYENALAYYPVLMSYQRFALCLIRCEKKEQATEVLNRALLLKDISRKVKIEIHALCYELYSEINLQAKADRHLRVGLELDPSSSKLILLKANQLMSQKKYLESKQSYEQVLQFQKNSYQAYNGLAEIELIQNKPHTAHDYLVMSLNISYQQPEVLVKLIKCAYQIKKFKPSEEILSRYIEHSPFSISLLYTLAGLRYHCNELESAANVLEKILGVNPNHLESKKLLKLIDQGTD